MLHFIHEYMESTVTSLMVIQLGLLIIAIAILVAGLWSRVAASSGTKAAISMRGIGILVSEIAPLIGVFGTLWGCRFLIPSLQSGQLELASQSMALALGTSLIGIATAVVGIAGATLLGCTQTMDVPT